MVLDILKDTQCTGVFVLVVGYLGISAKINWKKSKKKGLSMLNATFKIRFIFLMMLSVSALATELEDCNDPLLDIQCAQLTWSTAEFREDGSLIEVREKYNLYHTHENVLLPIVEIDESATSYLAFDIGVGSHEFQISTVEDGQEGQKSDIVTVMIVSPPAKIDSFTGEHIQVTTTTTTTTTTTIERLE